MNFYFFLSVLKKKCNISRKKMYNSLELQQTGLYLL